MVAEFGFCTEMEFSAEEKVAFVCGAYAMFEEVVTYLPPAHTLELREWLDDLRHWTKGAVPPPPHQWQPSPPNDDQALGSYARLQKAAADLLAEGHG